MEPIDEEAWNLADLEDVSKSEHMHNLADHTGDANVDNLKQSTLPKEPTTPD